MAKKHITGEDGKKYVMKEKKPFYKKWWFILIAAILVIGFIGSLGGDSEKDKPKVKEEATSNKTETKKEDKKENKQEEQVFKVGDTVDIKGYEIKVNSVEYSEGGEFMKPDEGKQYVIVNLTITNNAGERKSYNPLDYSLVADGNSESAGFTYLDGVETLSSGDLDEGATVTGNLVGQASPDAKLKLRYEGNIFLQNENVDIELN
ncbi:uncharacterized protein DUF4352 [Vagococcus fluvialis]|uniref:DUF4352 domain-containing protein n=1 Tax=Vagococcus fluvialis TaxID=2738 RepID=A0A369B0S2_9ENTE|nr:DUF4352 domain-containing protein [Vagococcus fluvialis]RCX15292.1 uncharacterized protein DUF4352 [Vagococcus fluvialis]RSU05438.1 DUF4352 domain-containing protein [Vagococcus fluvialis]